MDPLMEEIQTEMSALAEPLVRAAIGAVPKTLRKLSAKQAALAGPRRAAVNVALWDLVCRAVDVWADCADDTQLRGFLQVSILATAVTAAQISRTLYCGLCDHCNCAPEPQSRRCLRFM